MDRPVACRLDGVAARSQRRQWQTLLSGPGTSWTRPATTELRVRLDHGRRHTLDDLIRREMACCPFIDFSLRTTPDALVLRVAVPPDASWVLDRFTDRGDAASCSPEAPG